MNDQPNVPMPAPEQLAHGLANMLMAAIMGASSMGDYPACTRRTDEDACGAVLLAKVDDAGARHVHYCAQTADSAHTADVWHACVCGADWTERVDGVAEVVGPGETIVRPREQS